MNAIETKPSMNGTVKIARRGIAKFEFVEGETFAVDVIAIYDEWYEIDWLFRDEKGVLPRDKYNEHGQNRLNFVQGVVNDAYATLDGRQPPMLTRAEAEAFIVEIGRLAGELRNFFSPKKDESSSLPESSEGTRINFSQ